MEQGDIRLWRYQWRGRVLAYEMVSTSIIGWRKETKVPVFELHEVENVTAAPNEEDFHQRVVYRDKSEKKVQVACHEYRYV